MKKTAPPIAAFICGYDTPIIALANQFTKAVIATALGLKHTKLNYFSKQPGINGRKSHTPDIYLIEL